MLKMLLGLALRMRIIIVVFTYCMVFCLCNCSQKSEEPVQVSSSSLADTFVIINADPISETSLLDMGASVPYVDIVLTEIKDINNLEEFQRLDDSIIANCLNILTSMVTSKRLFVIRAKLIYLFCFGQQPSKYIVSFNLYSMHAATKSPYYYRTLHRMSTAGCIGIEDEELLMWIYVLASIPYMTNIDPGCKIASDFISIKHLKSRAKLVDYSKDTYISKGYSYETIAKYINLIEDTINNTE